MSNNETPESINEHLSALLDDEVSVFEQRRVLDELKNNDALSKKLTNFAMIGETMRSGKSAQTAPILSHHFLDSIHTQLDAEDAYDEVHIDEVVDSNIHGLDSSSVLTKKSTWLRPVGGFAIAASLGALALMGLQNTGLIGNQPLQKNNYADDSAPTAFVQTSSELNHEDSMLVTKKKTVTDQGSVTQMAQNEHYNDANARVRSSLKRYVDSHMQYATTSAFVPTARVIAYTDKQ